MKMSRLWFRRLSLSSLILSIMITQTATVTGNARADSPAAVAAIPGHNYTPDELADYSKEQLIELVISMQQQRLAMPTTHSTELAAPPAHRSSLGRTLGIVLGTVGVAMLLGKLQAPNNGGLSSNLGSNDFMQSRLRMLSAGGTCNTDVHITCGPYPIHQTLCAVVFPAFQSAYGVLSNNVSAKAGTDKNGSDNAPVRTSQVISAIVPFIPAAFLCNNGAPAVQATSSP